MSNPRDNTYAFNKGRIQPQDSVPESEGDDPTFETKEALKTASVKAKRKYKKKAVKSKK